MFQIHQAIDTPCNLRVLVHMREKKRERSIFNPVYKLRQRIDLFFFFFFFKYIDIYIYIDTYIYIYIYIYIYFVLLLWGVSFQTIGVMYAPALQWCVLLW